MESQMHLLFCRQRKSKGPVIERVGEAVKAIALCHNVTPVNEPNSKYILFT